MTEQTLLFDIQRFSIHDGPGIRTTLFFKGCPLRCRWCQNPESHKHEREIAFYKERCTTCFACMDACPERAVLELPDTRIDFDLCTACGNCVSACLYDALRMVGKAWTPEALFNEVLKDRDFFFDSGGGVTLSGGEPLSHVAFLKAFLPLVHNDHIHVTIETCGVFKWEEVEKIQDWIDLVYYDLKCVDKKLHVGFTGRDNKIILENFKRLSRGTVPLQPRMPVIPSLNDTRKNILDTILLLKETGYDSIHLVPYHPLGESKLSRIQTGLIPLRLPVKDNRYLVAIQEQFEKEGIHASIID